MTSSPTSVDLSRLPAPDAIETLSFEAMQTAFQARFLAFWEGAREKDPSLPAYDATSLEADPANIVGQAVNYLRLLDRARVNDAVRSVLAPLATGSNLDNIVARQGVQRLVVVPANEATGTPALMETDAALLRRYLLSFDRPSAGSAGRYLYEVFRAFPLAGDARVNGRAIHGRRGDTDVVVSGLAGRDATDAEMAAVRTAVTDPSVVPEAVSVSVLRAERIPYTAAFRIVVPPGPDRSLLEVEAIARVRAATDERTVIGGEVPAGLLAGAAYGPNVIEVVPLDPFVLPSDPYAVPVCVGVSVTAEVRT